MWRPGDPAPGGKKGKNKKKKRARTETPGNHPSKSDHGKKQDGLSSPHKRAKTIEEPKDKFIQMDSVDKQKGFSTNSSGRTQLSSTLRGLKFMVRKEEQEQARKAEAEKQRKLREEKWVIDPKLLETDTGKLVCQPLLTAPQRSNGRRSFGKYNVEVEKHQESIKQASKEKLEADELENAAIDADTMADRMNSYREKNGR